MNTDLKQIEGLRDIINLLIDNSLLLTSIEKQEFISLTPILTRTELMELMGLLIGSKQETDNIMNELVDKFPQVIKDLSEYQMNILQNVFKKDRLSLQTEITT